MGSATKIVFENNNLKVMDYPRLCDCKGVRTCLICEQQLGIVKTNYHTLFKNLTSYVFCPDCNKLYKGWNVDDILNDHINHNPKDGMEFPGVLVKKKFLEKEEATNLMHGLDDMPWDGSQSGRRKQNFGPKTNFKKMKLSTGNFEGFPEFTKFVQTKFENVPLLNGFKTVEQCSLEYDSSKGSSIDPHIDDCWVWGERVVTVNCLGKSVLTLSRYKGDQKRYNLPVVNKYQSTLLADLLDESELDQFNNLVIRIPMPELSLIVLYGPARYQFEHSVLREDILERRVCLAYREFTPLYLPDGEKYKNDGKIVLDQATLFWDHATRQGGLGIRK